MYANSTVYPSLSPNNRITPLYRPRPTGNFVLPSYALPYNQSNLTNFRPRPAGNRSWWEDFVGDSRPQNHRPKANWTA